MSPSKLLLLPAICVTLSGCANDKTIHFVAGAAASQYTREFAGGSPLSACAASLAVGVGKEFLDSRYGGVVDGADAVITAAGCLYTMRF